MDLFNLIILHTIQIGLDKILVSPDGDVTITNDGATILGQIQMGDEIAKLLSQLSKSQDDEIGDGTTGVIVLAGALFEQAELLLDKGVHPIKICEGFERASQIAVRHMESVSEKVDFDLENREGLMKAARTALGSKVVSKYQDLFAKIAVDAVFKVADLKRRDVNFDLIKIETKTGGSIGETTIVSGVVINKEFSHPQMPKVVKNPKIAILTCPFEPPKPKTKHRLEISSKEGYMELFNYEQEKFKNMIDTLKKEGVTCVMCQWGFDDEANHLLYQHNLPAVRWVGGPDIELIAIATGGRIIPRFEDISEASLGSCGLIREVSFGTTKERMLIIENCAKMGATTVLIRGGSSMIVEEAKRSLHDAMCVVRNLIRDNRVVYGGGAVDVSCALAVTEAAEATSSVEQQVMLAFASALESIPMLLSENSGLSPIETLAEIKSSQVNEKDHSIGLDCMKRVVDSMRKTWITDPLVCKRSQLYMATQLTKMILKIDDVIIPKSIGME